MINLNDLVSYLRHHPTCNTQQDFTEAYEALADTPHYLRDPAYDEALEELHQKRNICTCGLHNIMQEIKGPADTVPMMGREDFKKIPEGAIFRVVTTKYHTVERLDGGWPELTFVCKKGDGYDDWAIYYGLSNMGFFWIASHGNKVTTEYNIRMLFPCSQEVFELYRH